MIVTNPKLKLTNLSKLRLSALNLIRYVIKILFVRTSVEDWDIVKIVHVNVYPNFHFVILTLKFPALKIVKIKENVTKFSKILI